MTHFDAVLFITSSTGHSKKVIKYEYQTIDQLQWNLNLRRPDLRKNLDLRKIVGTTDFLVNKLFDLRKIF